MTFYHPEGPTENFLLKNLGSSISWYVFSFHPSFFFSFLGCMILLPSLLLNSSVALLSLRPVITPMADSLGRLTLPPFPPLLPSSFDSLSFTQGSHGQVEYALGLMSDALRSFQMQQQQQQQLLHAQSAGKQSHEVRHEDRAKYLDSRRVTLEVER